MESQQLIELATNARLNHWPPHLGVTTDAEKIEYLANALSSIDVKNAEIEALEDQIEALGEESIDLERKLDSRNDQIEILEDKVEALTDENEGLRIRLKEAEQTIGQLEARL